MTFKKYLAASEKPELNTIVLDNTKAPKNGGMSIEGLAATPEGDLWIGFRNPLPGGKALLARMRSPRIMLQNRCKASFSDAMLVDLGGHGVRDLVPLKGAGYLILSGPQSTGADFAIYRWDGKSSSATRLIKSTSTAVKLRGEVSAEALFLEPASCRYWLIFDEGEGLDEGGQVCKHRKTAEKSFHAVPVSRLVDCK